MGAGNHIAQVTANLVNESVGKGTATGKLIVGTGTAVAGHILAKGVNKAVSHSDKVDAAFSRVPVIGTIVKHQNDKARQRLSSLNKVTQSLLDGIDAVTDASAALTVAATQLGTAALSNSAKVGTAVGQTSVAVGKTIVQTGIDNVFTLGHNVIDQVEAGKFNITALRDNLSTGSKLILNDNAKSALTSLLPVLNQTFTSLSKKN
ncbi:Hypothetical protein NTJ_05679 [Nesidiocoris tenuis]|nr:Hypothetical protein NTJ_05679 [Nesidiocoris tenuis]